MTAATSQFAVWRRAVDQAHAGDARNLLELLLLPTQTDSRGKPMAGAFAALPDDADLRLAIVRSLMFGPWKGATTVSELMIKTGWGKGKPSVSEYEVAVADAMLSGTAKGDVIDRHDLAEGLGIAEETLRKRIDKRRQP